MVVDATYVKELRQNGTAITQELENILIDRLGTEPTSYTFSAQELYEQARKIVQRYRTPKGRLELKYGADRLENQLEYIYSKIQAELSSDKEEVNNF